MFSKLILEKNKNGIQSCTIISNEHHRFLDSSILCTKISVDWWHLAENWWNLINERSLRIQFRAKARIFLGSWAVTNQLLDRSQFSRKMGIKASFSISSSRNWTPGVCVCATERRYWHNGDVAKFYPGNTLICNHNMC